MSNKAKLLVAALVTSPAIALAQTTPAQDIEAAAATANTVFSAFAAVAVAAFVFRMVMKFARKGS